MRFSPADRHLQPLKTSPAERALDPGTRYSVHNLVNTFVKVLAMKRAIASMLCLLLVWFAGVPAYAEGDAAHLTKELGPLWSCLGSGSSEFTITAKAELNIDGKPQVVTGKLVRWDGQAFELDLKHPEYSLKLTRAGQTTSLVLPHHQVAYIGRGEVEGDDQLAPEGMLDRLIGSGSQLATFAVVFRQDDPATLAGLLTGLLKLKYDAEAKQWTAGKTTLNFTDAGRTIDVTSGDTKLHLTISETAEVSAPSPIAKVVEMDRGELERHLARGARRACEILAPSNLLTSPKQKNKKVEHGELRWIDGQRVVLLHGTPEQIGRAHGELLREESQRCIDSVLYTFGIVQTIRTGRWFKQDLAEAYTRLAPHIPQDHKVETRALAKALDLDPKLVETLNVFPELFHCSGFALFGKATADGKLYHGRVLDYMTTIGLQDSATTFIVAVDGKIPFANVGYGGFIGSVSGMNANAISLGEMGGRGEGKWDGAPMATLMRRALEECSTLDEVMDLWKNSPRTCEYYYVFADGKTNRAVGVAATPESIEFIQAGQTHERLGEGIEDAVVLSAGDRLTRLRERVKEKYGKIDAEAGQWLMCRPVAMESNLHNVLFVPADGVLYVANADHKQPAAERPYAKLDLRELLKSMPVKLSESR